MDSQPARQPLSVLETIATVSAHPFVSYVVANLEKQLDGKLAKEVLTLARYQGLPRGSTNSSLWNRTRDAVDMMLGYVRKGRDARGDNLQEVYPWNQIDTLLSQPHIAGALVMASLVQPWGDEAIEREKMASYMKEIRIMDSDRYDPNINWRPFFYEEARSERVHDDVPENPKSADVVRSSIERWLTREERRTAFPSLSKKLLPTFAVKEMDRWMRYLKEDYTLSTPRTLERLYLETGVVFTGEAELKQRWYTNGLTPRSYFVSGADAWDKARYLKETFNNLVDALSVSNKLLRVKPERITAPATLHHFLFYDLTSFTSNLGCQYSFLKFLAGYTKNSPVTLFHPCHGYYTENLGEEIDAYAELLNYQPRYQWTFGAPGVTDSHGVAGFLGVVGNIATANFIHAAILLQCAENDRECSCAGDDAVIVVMDDYDDAIYASISLLGILQTEKVYNSTDVDIVYLKRRVEVEYGPVRHTLKSYEYLQYPSFIFSMTATEISKYREASYTPEERMVLAAHSLSATFRSAGRIYNSALAVPQEVVEMIKRYYRLLRFPLEGHLPQRMTKARVHASRLLSGLFIPSVSAFGDPAYVSRTSESLYKGYVRLPLRERTDSMPRVVRGGETMTIRPNRVSSYLTAIGVIEEVSIVEKDYYGHEGLARMIEELDTVLRRELPPPMMTVRIESQIPKAICSEALTVSCVDDMVLDWCGGIRKELQLSDITVVDRRPNTVFEIDDSMMYAFLLIN